MKENVKISKYENIKITNNSSIKWGRWTCIVTNWFEKIMEVSTCWSGDFFLIENSNFNNLVHTDISQEIGEIDAKIRVP